MKARKVILTLEVLTDLPVAKLRAADGVSLYYSGNNKHVGEADSLTETFDLVQIQANAVSDKPKQKTKK